MSNPPLKALCRARQLRYHNQDGWAPPLARPSDSKTVPTTTSTIFCGFHNRRLDIKSMQNVNLSYLLRAVAAIIQDLLDLSVTTGAQSANNKNNF